MNIDATEDDLRNVAEMFRLAALLDDRVGQADKARIAVWAEQIHRHKFTREDILDGLQRFYDDAQSRAIAVGDLIACSKVARRVRVGKEDAAERERRQIEQEAKVAADDWPVPRDPITGPTAHKTDRMRAAEDRLHVCHDQRTAVDAIREYFAAKAEARKGGKR